MQQGPWKFVIYLPPKGAARPRSSVQNDEVHVYPEQATENWKATVSWVAAKALPREILEGPVRVTIVALVPRPKKLCERRKDGTLKCGEEGILWTISLPDHDNILKVVYDGMKSIWRDDRQVCLAYFAKCYAEIDGRPRVIVEVDRCSAEVPAFIKAFAASAG